MKTIYISMEADIIHPGNINIIKKAKQYWEIIIWLSSDKLMARTTRLPFMNWEQRKTVLENINWVSKIIKQDSIEWINEIKELKPDFIIHWDNWKNDNIKNNIIKILKEVWAELIEIKHTKWISSNELYDAYKEIWITPDVRRSSLKKLLKYKWFITAMEAHNWITWLIVEKTKVNKEDGSVKEFDAMWSSSLTDSTAKWKPDIELVDVTSRVNSLQEILEVTTKPIIYDWDTWWKTEHFVYTVKTLDKLWISAVIIEDKVWLKKNSLFWTWAWQQQDTIEWFCEKIKAWQNAKVSKDFMIIARIESLILKQWMEDALKRAKAYIKDWWVDWIMIHSKEKEPDEIIEFCKKFKEFWEGIPLIVVPTSYNKITEDELKNIWVNVCIYANHLIRAAYPAMVKVSKEILENERSYEVDKKCLSIKEILHLIPWGQ